MRNSSCKFVALVVILQLPAGAFAGDKVSWPEGAIFTYVEQDGFTKQVTGRGTLTVKKRLETGYEVVERIGDQDTLLSVSSSGTYTRPKPGSSDSFSYVPVKLPIDKGGAWEWTYHYVGRNTGAIGVTTRRCEAESQEEIEVPAGKFTAWRIVCKGSWNSRAGSSGSNSRTMWYAPALSIVIRTEERSSYFGGVDRSITILESVSGL